MELLELAAEIIERQIALRQLLLLPFQLFLAELLLHATDFLGQVLRRPPAQGIAQPGLVQSEVPAPIVNKDQTVAILSFVQPITPTLQVHQAVKIARAMSASPRPKPLLRPQKTRKAPRQRKPISGF